MKLIIGNKNYSSWSLRPWLAMKVAGITFEEEVIPLYEPDSPERVAKYSPVKKVPVLIDGDVTVWESLAILEYLAEKYPSAGMWPADTKARAQARTVSNEMHAGFQALRKNCPMNLWLPPKPRAHAPDVLQDADRIEAIWADCRTRFADGGEFLFGAFSAADAMYAPVVARFYNYGFSVSSETKSYMKAVMALPAWAEWKQAAFAEPWVMQGNEPDWPNVVKLKS